MTIHPLRAAAIIAALLIAASLAPAASFANDRKPAPDLELPDLNGRCRSCPHIRGRSWSFLSGPPGCPQCITEIGALNRVTDQYRDRGVTVLSVSVDKHEKALWAFLASTFVKYPVGLDATGENSLSGNMLSADCRLPSSSIARA